MIKRISNFVIISGNVIVLIGLALLAYTGFYNRYWSDDWCYSADARQLGTIGATLQYFGMEGTGYAPNRYSTTFLAALTENSLGIFGNQIYALCTIIFWLIGIVWTLSNINRFKLLIPFEYLLLASTLILYYNLYISPQRFQILYWRSGILPYSTPIVLWLLITGIITYQMSQPLPIKWANFLIALLAFVAAGLGEVDTAFLFSIATMVVLGVWLAKRKNFSWAKKIFNLTVIAWIFLLLGMLVLVISPSNMRINKIGADPIPPLEVPFKATANGLAFINISLRTLPLPHIIFFTIVFSFSILATKRYNFSLTSKQLFFHILIAILVMAILVIAVHTPNAYFYGTPPDPRGKAPARFILLIALSFIAWQSGNWAGNHLKSNLISWVSILILMLGLTYTARSIYSVYMELPGFIQRANLWDERDAFIKSEKANGNMLVEVTVIDTADINTRDMFPSVGKGWLEYRQNCAARYYGVEGLKVKSDP